MVILITTANLQVCRLHEELTKEHHRQNDTDDPQRISDGTPQRRTTAGQPQLLQCLLRRTEGWGIGRGTTKDTHHVGEAHGQHGTQNQRKQGSHQDDRHAPKVKRYPLVAHRPEEVGAHIKSQHIDKHRQTETFGKLQHAMVDGQTEMACHNTHEKNKSYTE